MSQPGFIRFTQIRQISILTSYLIGNQYASLNYYPVIWKEQVVLDFVEAAPTGVFFY